MITKMDAVKGPPSLDQLRQVVQCLEVKNGVLRLAAADPTFSRDGSKEFPGVPRHSVLDQGLMAPPADVGGGDDPLKDKLRDRLLLMADTGTLESAMQDCFG